MAFSFGFSGDDIDSSIDNADDIQQPLNGGADQAGVAENDASMVGEKVQRHGLDEMVCDIRLFDFGILASFYSICFSFHKERRYGVRLYFLVRLPSCVL